MFSVELREKLENIELEAQQRKNLHGFGRPWLVTYVLLLFFVGLLGFKFFLLESIFCCGAFWKLSFIFFVIAFVCIAVVTLD